MAHRRRPQVGLTMITAGKPAAMIALILILLLIWVAFGVIGFVVKGLLWLAIIGIALFVITAIVGAVRGRSRT
jgi:hypothetical protein